MTQKHAPDPLEGWLETLGLASLCQWDVLVFLYRHQASLVSAEHIARLLGYDTGAIVAALDSLGSSGLVDRSRVDQGVRLYQFAAPTDPRRGGALEQLMNLADSRATRLHLIKAGRAAGVSPPVKSKHRRPSKNQVALAPPSPMPGGASWRKAI